MQSTDSRRILGSGRISVKPTSTQTQSEKPLGPPDEPSTGAHLRVLVEPSQDLLDLLKQGYRVVGVSSPQPNLEAPEEPSSASMMLPPSPPELPET